MKLIKIIDKLNRSNYIEYFAISLIVIAAFSVRLYKINNPIADWHSWRQVDTASVTKNYLIKGVDLLRPRYHDVSSIQTGYFNPEGYRFVEFPVFNLVHLYIYKIFPDLGFDPAGRMTTILFFMSSLVPIYFLGRKYIGKWGGIICVFIYGLMPYNVYFTRVILPDGMAVALGVWAVYLFDLFIETNKIYKLYLSGILFSLAILTKPFVVFYGVPMIYLVYEKYGFKKSLQQIPLYLFLNIILIPFFVWRGWVNRPPQLYGVAKLSWAFNGNNIRFKPSHFRWIFSERIGKLMLGSWGLIPFGIGIITDTKGKSRYFLNYFMLGVVLYVFIVATANVQHDYYQLFLVPPVSLLTAKGLNFLMNSVQNKLLGFILALFCVFMIFGVGVYEIKGNYAINHPEIMIAGKRMQELSSPDDWIIAPYNGDTTFLYQTGRWGWPVIDNSIENIIEKGADYYISVDLGSADTLNFKQKYEIVEENNDYIILDLRKAVKN